MRCNSRRAVSLAGMVAAGQESDAALAGIVGLGLGNLARDEGVGAGGDRRFEIPLRAAGAPGDPADLALSAFDQGQRPAQHVLDVGSQLLGVAVTASVG